MPIGYTAFSEAVDYDKQSAAFIRVTSFDVFAPHRRGTVVASS